MSSVDGAVLGTQNQPAVFVRVIGPAGEQNRLGGNPAHQHFSSRAVQVVQSVQIGSGELDAVEGLPGKARFGEMAIFQRCAHHGFVAEFRAQARQRAVGGVEIARRLLGKKTQLFSRRGA